jgi:hypothetical protein
MWSENESARHAFTVLASAALLRAERQKHSAMCRALVIQSRELIAELHNLKPIKGRCARTSDDPNNRLHRVWLSQNPHPPST